MTSCVDSCVSCKKSGLAILPTRYAVVPWSVEAMIPPSIRGERVFEVAIKRHDYALRTLREGWVYLFYELGAEGTNYWEVYRVTADGRLWKRRRPLSRVALREPTCSSAHFALPVEILALPFPELCGNVHIAFAETAWSEHTFRRYEDEPDMRARRMQCIKPATWIAGGEQEHCADADVGSIDQVVEYMPGLDPCLLLPRDDEISQRDGRFDPYHLGSVMSRYGLHVRQRSPESASEAMVTLMQGVGASPSRRCHRPMLLALWDGVGMVHELAGFRTAASVHQAKYARERELEVDALQSIDVAEAAVRANSIASAISKRELLTAANQALLYMPFPLPEDMQEANRQREINEREAARTLDHDFAVEVSNKAWERYQKKLQLRKLAVFRVWFDKLRETVNIIHGNNTPDLAAWLDAPLFHDALADCHPDNLADGVDYEDIVATALHGLASEPQGEAVLATLVARMDLSDPRSFLWRAFAFNQREPVREMSAVLKQVQEDREKRANANQEAVNAIVSRLGDLKMFSALYDNLRDMPAKGPWNSPGDAAMKATGGDRLVIAMGKGLFEWTAAGKLGYHAGTYLIRGAMLMRAGLAQADAVEIVRQSISVEEPMKDLAYEYFRKFRAQGMTPGEACGRAFEELAEHDGGRLLRAKWAEVRVGANRHSIEKAVGLAGTLAVIELLMFGARCIKNDKDREDYALLVASGLSAVAACLQPVIRALDALDRVAAVTVRTLTGVAAYFCGISALISAVADWTKVSSQRSHGSPIAYLYGVKAFLGMGNGAAYVLTAFSSSAPAIARMTGFRAVTWLGFRLGAGIAGAGARSNAIRATAEAGLDAAARRLAVDALVNSAMTKVFAEVAVVTAQRGGLLILGRVLLFMTSWEIALVIALIQLVMWVIEDDELEDWMRQSAFGVEPTFVLPFVNEQREAFKKAMEGTGYQD